MREPSSVLSVRVPLRRLAQACVAMEAKGYQPTSKNELINLCVESVALREEGTFAGEGEAYEYLINRFGSVNAAHRGAHSVARALMEEDLRGKPEEEEVGELAKAVLAQLEEVPDE